MPDDSLTLKNFKNIKNLDGRLIWEESKIDDLLRKGRIIQNRLLKDRTYV